jgi:hypothetical protein
MNLHYGCGLDTGAGWHNCDASPTLRLQRLPLIGWVFKKWLKPRFPDAVHYGDIVRGMEIAPDSCEAIYCSHILEHLALEDLRTALRHTRACLKPGGLFRLVVPDFAQQVLAYQSNPNPEALSNFLRYTHLGRATRPKGYKAFIREYFGNSHHLWMWDEKGLVAELQQAGFSSIRRCQAGDSSNKSFLAVENPDRFLGGLAIECSK